MTVILPSGSGRYVHIDVGELAGGGQDATIFLDLVGVVDGAGPGLDLGHDLGGGHEAIALNEDVADEDAAGGRRSRRLGETGHAAQEHAQQNAGAAQRRRIKAILRLHGLVPVVPKTDFRSREGDG